MSASLSRWQVLLMAFATGLSVGANYYNQPLLHSIAAQFGLSFAEAGIVVTTAQLSYAAGLLLLVPLGDLLERRRLIVVMTLLGAVGLAISAWSPSLHWLLIGTAVTGLFSVVAQVLVPLAATLAPEASRGRVVGTVMSGLILGILLARTVAGSLSSLGDWRTVYGVTAVVSLGMALALWRVLPRYRHGSGLRYPQLIASVFVLFREEPVHRLHALLGALCFATFATFWTPLAFLLSSPPYHFSDAAIGLFGLAGAAGALAANVAGRMADAGRGHRAISIALACLALAWLPLAFARESILALLLGILVLDIGVQLAHVSNQNVIYRLRPEARSRLNAGHMTVYFLGGALGSGLAAPLYQQFGWNGVCGVGVGLALLALAAWFGLRRQVWRLQEQATARR